MADVENIIRFRQEGDQAVLATYDSLIAKAVEAEKATESVFTGVADEAKKAAAGTSEVVSALTTQGAKAKETEGLNKKAALSFTSIRDAAKAMGAGVKDAVGNISIFGVSINSAREKLGSARKALGDYANSSKVAGAAAKASGSASAVGFSLARVGALALRTALGPIGLIITVVAVAFTLLAKAAKRSEPIMNAVAVVTAAVSAGVDVLIDRMTAVAEVIFFANKAFLQFAAGNFDGAMESFSMATASATAATASLNIELREEIANAIALEQLQQRIDRNLFNLEIRRAKANADLKALNKITEDLTKTDQERIDAAVQFRNIQEGLVSEEIEAREEQIAQILGQTEVTDELRAKILELGTAGIAFDELGDAANKFSTTLGDIGDGRTIFSDEDTARLKDNVVALFNLQTQSDEILTTSENKRRTIQAAAETRRLKAIADLRKAEEDLASFRLQLEQQIQQLAVDNSEGEERIRLEESIAQQQLTIAEETAREKFALAKQEFDLESEFAQLRQAVAEEAEKNITAFRFAERQKQVADARDRALGETELLSASADAELTLEEFKASERVRITRDSLIEQRAIAQELFGADSAEVLAIDVQLNVAEGAAVKVLTDAQKRIQTADLAAVEQRKQIRLLELDFIKESTDDEIGLEAFKQREKNKVLIDALLDRRRILAEEFGENSPEIKLLDLEIGLLQDGIDNIEKLDLSPLEKIKARIQEAFGIDEETLNLIAEQATGAFNNIVAGLESIYERQLIEQDKLIEQIDERVDVLQGALDRELELQEQGFANNAGLAQADLDAELARKEQEENKRLEIEKKAANQQLLIDAARQASSLALATANLLANEALKGLPGILLAGTIGFATIFATIQKARATAASFKAPEFRGGGFAKGVLVGPSHEQGGVFGTYSSSEGQRVLNMEGDEHIMPVRETQQYAPALEAMRTGSIRGMKDEDVLQMLGRNPTLSINPRTSFTPKPDNTGTEFRKVGKEIVGAIMGQMQIVPDGKGGYKFIDPTGVIPPYGGRVK